jgi:photosystem II stability/assembly factor-like uncharacterized protein
LGEKSIGALLADKNGHLFASGNEYIFRSVDDGASWTQLRNGLTNNNINCLAIDADGILFASAYSYEGALHRSADNGESWEHIGEGLTINTILCHSQELFIGANGCGVLVSNDKGENWAQKNKGFPEPRINAIAINKSDHIFVASDGSGIYRSTDDGATWQQVNTGLSPAADFYPDAIACGDDGTLFMGCSRIFKSNDNGDSWVAVSDYMSTNVESIVLNPDGHIFAIGDGYGAGLFCSFDAGNSWEQRANGLAETFPQSLAINKATGDLYLGTSQGLYVSKDIGNSWQQTNLKEPMILALAVNSSSHIFAGTDDGLYRSEDQGDNWAALKNGFPWSPWIYAIEIKMDGTVLVASTDGVYVSGDNGESWTESSGFQAAAFAINSSGTVFAGSRFSGIYKGTEE